MSPFTNAFFSIYGIFWVSAVLYLISLNVYLDQGKEEWTQTKPWDEFREDQKCDIINQILFLYFLGDLNFQNILIWTNWKSRFISKEMYTCFV